MRSIKAKSKEATSIGEALFPKIRRQLLAHFFLAQDRRHYFREITRLVNASPGAVQRELKMLVDAGILATEKMGRQKYYWADPECMVYSELKAIVVKTFGVVDTISAALSQTADVIEVAFVYGSIASGRDTGKSDIDLMVIGEVGFRTLAKALRETESLLSRPINPTLFSPEEFGRKTNEKNHFLKNVLNADKLMIIGTENDLARLAQ
jgi:predicted nucleotidyltransferase